jgi:hypothetical protein
LIDNGGEMRRIIHLLGSVANYFLVLAPSSTLTAPRGHELSLIRLFYHKMITLFRPLKTPHYHIVVTTYQFKNISSSTMEYL